MNGRRADSDQSACGSTKRAATVSRLSIPSTQAQLEDAHMLALEVRSHTISREHETVGSTVSKLLREFHDAQHSARPLVAADRLVTSAVRGCP